MRWTFLVKGPVLRGHSCSCGRWRIISGCAQRQGRLRQNSRRSCGRCISSAAGGVIGDTDLFGLEAGLVPSVGRMFGVHHGAAEGDVCFAASSAGDLYLIRPEGSVYRFVPDEGAADREWPDLAAWLADVAIELRQRVIAGTASPLPMKGR